jgi:hypothetical protein
MLSAAYTAITARAVPPPVDGEHAAMKHNPSILNDRPVRIWWTRAIAARHPGLLDNEAGEGQAHRV